MPNYCDTTYKCVGDLNEVKSLHKVLKYIDKRKTSILKNGFGKWWLGNLVTKLGGDWEKYRCRGEITDYSLDENVLTINQCTAWCEQSGVRRIIEEIFPSIKVYYMEEESGCELFSTNDTSGLYFPSRYILDSTDEWEEFDTIDEAAKFVSKIVGKAVNASFDDVIEALEIYQEEHDDDVDKFFSFHQIEVVD